MPDFVLRSNENGWVFFNFIFLYKIKYKTNTKLYKTFWGVFLILKFESYLRERRYFGLFWIFLYWGSKFQELVFNSTEIIVCFSEIITN